MTPADEREEARGLFVRAYGFLDVYVSEHALACGAIATALDGADVDGAEVALARARGLLDGLHAVSGSARCRDWDIDAWETATRRLNSDPIDRLNREVREAKAQQRKGIGGGS